MSSEFGTGKTIIVLAIVVGCFAILWPKIFYPMLTASVKQPAPARQGVWREANVQFLTKLCYLLEEHQAVVGSGAERWTSQQCSAELLHTCGHNTSDEKLLEGVRLGKDGSNLTQCLADHYDLTPALVAAAAPPKVRPRAYLPQGINSHARPERPTHLYPEMMHPALREKGRAMPQRTVDKQGRRGPLPGVRPPMGGPGGIVPPPQGKGSGAMGIIMPLYTVGIVVFFVYTIMKVLFKKGQDDDKTPKLKDFGLDPEYRKYVFAEEYLDNAEISSKEQIRRQQREESRTRKKYQDQQQAETKIGEWYLPEGFLNQTDEDIDDEDMNISIGGTTIDESARETFRDRLLKGIYWKKQQTGKSRTRGQLREQLTIEDCDWNEAISLLENQESQCRNQHGQGRKTQILKEPVFEVGSRKKEDMLNIDDMYNDDFFQVLKNGLRRCNQHNEVDGESIEELCQIAWDHLCSKQNARDTLSSLNLSSEEEQNYPEDARLKSSPGLFCKSKLMTDNEPLGVPQSARKLHSSNSYSSGESEENKILSFSKSGNDDNSHDITEDLVDYRTITEDKSKEIECTFRDEDEDTGEEQGDSLDDLSATFCI